MRGSSWSFVGNALGSSSTARVLHPLSLTVRTHTCTSVRSVHDGRPAAVARAPLYTRRPAVNFHLITLTP